MLIFKWNSRDFSCKTECSITATLCFTTTKINLVAINARGGVSHLEWLPSCGLGQRLGGCFCLNLQKRQTTNGMETTQVYVEWSKGQSKTTRVSLFGIRGMHGALVMFFCRRGLNEFAQPWFKCPKVKFLQVIFGTKICTNKKRHSLHSFSDVTTRITSERSGPYVQKSALLYYLNLSDH